MKTAPKYSLRRRFLVIFCPAFSCAFEMAAHKWRTNLRLPPDKTKHAATRNFPKPRAFSMVEVTRFELAAPTSRTWVYTFLALFNDAETYAFSVAFSFPLVEVCCLL